MAGPHGTPVLDDFNRADTGPPPSANWTDTPGRSGLIVVSNQAAPNGTGTNRISCWNAATFTPATGTWAEVFTTVAALAATNDTIENGLFDSTDSRNSHGYHFEWLLNGNLNIKRRDGSTAANPVIATRTAPTLAAGNRVGLSVEDSTIRVWHDAGGGWSSVLEVNDTTYRAAFYATLNLLNVADGWRADDFGAGTYSPPAGPALFGAGRSMRLG